MGKRWARLCAVGGSLIVIVGTATGGSLAASAASTHAAASGAATAVAPNPVNMLDCNGHSTKYKDVKQDLGGLCTDPRGTWGGRFEDNGTYIGHDEPSVKFISSAPGSGNDMTYVNRLSRDPAGNADRLAERQDGQRLCRAEPGTLVRAADLRPRLLPAEPVQAGQ